MTKFRTPSDTPRPGTFPDLADTDKRLAQMLLRRTRALARTASERREAGKPLVSPAQEKALWAVWYETFRAAGLPERLVRQLFISANSLAYEAVKAPQARGQAFVMTPASGPMALDVEAPVSSRKAMYLAALAAFTGSPCVIGPLALADPLAEFVKGCNQAGAHLSWDGPQIVCRQGDGMAMDGLSLFAGASERGFSLLLAAAIASQANCRFSGGAELKMLDVGPYARLLPQLGARLAPIDRRAPGLPVRLEAGGETPRDVQLPDECPEELAAGLLLFAWRFEKGLRLTFTPGSPASRGVIEAAPVLALCGLSVRLAPDSAEVRAGQPVIPAEPTLPADPFISALFLSMARFRGGAVRLQGLPDMDSPLAADALALLEAAGTEVVITGNSMQARASNWPAAPVFAPRSPDSLPLALCLAAAAARGARVELPQVGVDGIWNDEARDFLDSLGKNCEALTLEDGREALNVAPGFGEVRPVYAPDAAYALAMGALSLSKSPLALENPGIAATLWPGFWNMFNRLPAMSGSLFARKEIPDDVPTPRRRIKVR